MPRAESVAGGLEADVALVLEGTYPYVRGGVSTWVHDLIGSLPEVRFSLVHIGPERGAYAGRRYRLPANVTTLTDLWCRDRPARGAGVAALERSARAERHRHDGLRDSRVLRAIRRLHLEDADHSSLIDDLAARDLPIGAFLHGRAAFDLAAELYERLAPGASLLDFYWHFRSMHAPLVRLLEAEAPAAATYHAVCTGYAGLLAAVWSHRTGRRFLLTEHGIYTRERKLELDRAAWFGSKDGRRRGRAQRTIDGATASALRAIWIHFFRALSRCAYSRATTIVSLCEANRDKQVADGAPLERTRIVPNGIRAFQAADDARAPAPEPRGRAIRIGLVGRVVPIKDVVTFIRACRIARQSIEFEAAIFGPLEEDPAYVRRCRRLVVQLGLESVVRFAGTLPPERVYAAIDVLVLTSLSEAQPLVLLEAGAARIPVIASDVGACRELIEGRAGADRWLGPGGIVTRIADPEQTAAAIVRLARDPALRLRMGGSGRSRVGMFYREQTTISAYRTLYREGLWPASAGASSA